MNSILHFTLKAFFIVIILTTFSNCALLLQDPFSEQGDTIADAAPSRGRSHPENEPRMAKHFLSRHEEIHRALESGDVTLGMSMNEVIAVWGQPRETETAGDPQLGNQRWIYSDSRFKGWRPKSPRIVYFEEGRVAGWENAQN